MLPFFMSQIPALSTLQSETVTWRNAVIAAGSSVPMHSLIAHDQFIAGLKADGIRSLIGRCNTYGAASLAGAMIPIIIDYGGASDTNHNFVSTDFSLPTGLKGDASSKYLDTGLAAATIFGSNATSAHLSIINTTASLGRDLGTVNYFQLQTQDGAVYSFDCFQTRVSTTPINTGIGISIGSRTSASSQVLYYNGIAKASGSTTSAAAPDTNNVYVFACNSGTTASGFCGATGGSYSIGFGLTAAQALAFTLRLNTLMIMLGRTGQLETETSTWLAAVIAAGSTVNAVSLAAHDNFIKSSKAKGYRTLIGRMNTYGANDVVGAMIPIIKDYGATADTNHNFVSTDFNLSTGLKGDGSTKYLDTGLTPAAIFGTTTTSGHMSVMNLIGNPSVQTWRDIGTTNLFQLISCYQPGGSGGFGFWDSFSSASGRISGNVTGNPGAGLFVGSRTSASSTTYYRNNVVQFSGTNASASNPDSGNIFVFAANTSGTPANFTGYGQSVYSIGFGLTAQNVSDYTNDLGALNIALGRLQPETITWVKAVAAAGSTVSNTSILAHDDFVSTAKAEGYFSSIQRLNTFGANTLSGSMIPIICGVGGAADVNHNFVSGDFSLSTGLQGDGSTKYLDTGANALSVTTANSTHIGAINTTSLTQGSAIRAEISVSNGTTASALQTLTTTSHPTLYMYDVPSSINSTTVTTTSGFWLGTRTSASAITLYRNGVSEASGTTSSSTSVPSLNYYVLAQNSSGSSTNYSTNLMQAYTIGLGLTSAQVTRYYGDLALLMSALGRTIPA